MKSSRDLADYETQYKNLPFEKIQLRYRRQLVIREIHKHSPKKLLEIGCGELPLFSDLPQGINITVVEPIEAFAANATQMANDFSNVKVINCLVEDFFPYDFDYDIIILSCVLHEADDPQRMLQAVRRLCSRGTILHLNVPNARSMHRLLAVAMGLISDIREPSATQRLMQQREMTYDLDTLQQELHLAGFSVLNSGSIFVKPFTHSQMQYLVNIGFMTESMLGGLSELDAWLPGIGSEIWINARVTE